MIGIPDFAKAPLLNAYANNLSALVPTGVIEMGGFTYDVEASAHNILSEEERTYLHSICALRTGVGGSVYLMRSDRVSDRIDSAKQRANYLSLRSGNCSILGAGYGYNTAILLESGDFSQTFALDSDGDNTLSIKAGDCCCCTIRTDYTVGTVRFECGDGCEFAVGFWLSPMFNNALSFGINLSFSIGSEPAMLCVNDRLYKLWPYSREYNAALGGRYYGDKTYLMDTMYRNLDTWYTQYTDYNFKKAKAEARGKATEPKRAIA